MTFLHGIGSLGRQVRTRRKELRLTQATLAEAAAVSRYTLIKLERGQLNDINLKTVLALLRPLGLQLSLGEPHASGLPVFGGDPGHDRGQR